MCIVLSSNQSVSSLSNILGYISEQELMFMATARLQILYGEFFVPYIFSSTRTKHFFVLAISMHHESALSILRSNENFLSELKVLCTLCERHGFISPYLDSTGLVAEIYADAPLSSSSSSLPSSDFYNQNAPLIAPLLVPRHIILAALHNND